MPVSIISCNLSRDGKELGALNVRLNNGVVGSYRLRYQVEMAAPCGPLEVISQAKASGSPDRLPSLWSTYAFENDTDLNSYAQKISVDRDPKSKRNYYIEVDYLPVEPGQQPDGGGAPIDSHAVPTERKPRIWWERQVTSSLISTNVNGAPIVNFSNTLYEDLLQHDRTKAVLVAEINSQTIAASINLERIYSNAVNSIAWTFRGATIEPRAALIREVVTGQPLNEGAFTYCKTQFRITFADIGHNWDDGFVEMSQTHFTKTSNNYDVDSSGYRKITDAGRLVPLNTDGTRLPDNQSILTSTWATHKQADFNLLTILNT